MRYGHFIMAILCAWVLWGYIGLEPYAIDTYKEREECAIARDADNASAKRDGTQVHSMCLPDTVDPRAPKASR